MSQACLNQSCLSISTDNQANGHENGADKKQKNKDKKRSHEEAEAREEPSSLPSPAVDNHNDGEQIKKKKKGKDAVEIERHTATVSGIMSAQTFDQLELTDQTRKGIQEMNFANMTEVQARTIPPLLVGRDVLAAAKTGE